MEIINCAKHFISAQANSKFICKFPAFVNLLWFCLSRSLPFQDSTLHPTHWRAWVMLAYHHVRWSLVLSSSLSAIPFVASSSFFTLVNWTLWRFALLRVFLWCLQCGMVRSACTHTHTHIKQRRTIFSFIPFNIWIWFQFFYVVHLKMLRNFWNAAHSSLTQATNCEVYTNAIERLSLRFAYYLFCINQRNSRVGALIGRQRKINQWKLLQIAMCVKVYSE